MLILAGCLGGAALFFFLGYLVAARPASSLSQSRRQPLSCPASVSQQPRTREGLAKALAGMEKRVAACQPPIVVSRHWEIMRSGTHKWSRVKLQGQYHDLDILEQVLEVEKKVLVRDFNLRILIHLDKSAGVLNLLILDGEEVVVVGSFVDPSEELLLEAKPDRPQLAIVIDDLGRNLESAAELAALPLPLTFAVFPRLENSTKVAAYFTDHHRDIILHAPMEPRGYPLVDPGPGALLSAMGEAELSAVFIENLQSLPGIIGVNNHMGSRLTADSQKMAQVMKILRGRNLFFLDSRTIADTVAYKEAVEAGIPALQRDIFLDNVQDEEHIVEQFRALIEVARVKGSAIGIGHPYSETAAALATFSEMAGRAGVEVVALRELVR
ncbi:MAG: divergent polysaccharide deacetylase family protein [Pseudomonadota bacterium]|nr:divergent polysaccharide deacetylase family protein [Pseudomonadota bacterium]